MSALLLLLAAAPPSPVLASLERTTCMGSCPAYTITARKDGTLETAGGIVSDKRKLTPAQLDALKKLFTDAKFLETSYAGCFAKDVQFTKLFFTDGKQKKKVEYFRSSFCASSDALEPLSTKFLQAVGIDEPV